MAVDAVLDVAGAWVYGCQWEVGVPVAGADDGVWILRELFPHCMEAAKFWAGRRVSGQVLAA